ncbi:MAG: hypothetical protein MH204_06055 [Fimbriimonadaceae bacterium]|nr:hypothetical protein [Fimbriimonadaceae bacterium]
MHDVKAIWGDAMPEAMNAVSGVGVWTAIRTVVPIAFEEGVFVLGLPHQDSELVGHLRLAQTKRAIETALAGQFNKRVEMRVITGTTPQDWETEKRRDAEKRRLQEQALARARAEHAAGKSWETIYEQLSRKYAATPARSLPQNRAKFFLEAVDIVAEALIETPISDDMAERNYARCLERIATYCELPSAYVAVRVLEKSFGG